MNASMSTSSAQMSLGGLAGPNNGRPSEYTLGAAPQPIRSPSRPFDSDSDTPAGLSSQNNTSYGAATAWRVKGGRTPPSLSAQTIGSFRKFQ